ncbi:MAG: HprK-related kinase A [Burkholderiales bacterium]|nr:HprK-related kinase A [Burkholderiales bacterium]
MSGVKLGDLSHRELRACLAAGRLRLRTGPFVSEIESHLDDVVEGLATLYPEFPLAPEADFTDFVVRIDRPRGLRRWLRPQVVFEFDGEPPFAPLPGDQGLALLEWGLNWSISAHSHQYLILHAAVLERNGGALILPAPSGAGKSTLCAGLAFNGWRLLSDELTVIDPATLQALPVPRPISLKNRSIEVIREFAPGACFGRVVEETSKGSVAHVRPPGDAIPRAGDRAAPRWIVMPRYRDGAEPRLEPLPKARALMQAVDCCFSFNVHRQRGFDALARLVDECQVYEFSYSRLGEAVEVFDRLAAGAAL